MLLREKLKAATREAHTRLEARLGLDSPGLSRERYADYLECMLAFHRAIAPKLEAARGEWAALPECHVRIGWLEDDLGHVGRTPAARDVPQECLPPLDGIPEVIGCSYVLEGASLGGVVLYAQLRTRWGLERGAGASFLFGYGARTAVRWRTIVDAINAAALGPDDETRCIAAARATFAGLDGWLN